MMESTEQSYIEIKPGLVIPLSEIGFQFSRSGGPGGQNVNRRETRVELLYDVRNSPSLSEEQRERLLARLGGRLDSDGILHIVAHAQRSQLRNRQEAVERLVQLLRRALDVPRRRLPTRASRQAIEQRLAAKRKRSQAKELRRRLPLDE